MFSPPRRALVRGSDIHHKEEPIMLKHIRRLGAAAGLAVAAGAVLITGLAAASAAPSAAATEHFQIMTTSVNSNPRVIAYGAFTGAAVDHQHEAINTDTFKFVSGSFKIKHSPGTGKQSFNPKTCVLTVSEHGTYTLGHGTGSYAGISGHGTFKLSILEIAARSKGNCSMNRKPVAFQSLINAQGPVHL
jgi:hypothetical protein